MTDVPAADTAMFRGVAEDATEAETRGHEVGSGAWRIELAPVWRKISARLASTKPQTWVTLAVVAGCSLFVFNTVHPELILRNSTPTGGDMGSHLWGPNYLMHHLLPKGRVTGWTPDWYAGFPAFQFYMVLPALMVVALNVGVRNPFLFAPALAIAVAVLVSGWFVPALARWRRVLFGVGVALVVLTFPVPYNVSFKLITVSGLVALPVAAWAFGRLSGLAFPGPPLLAMGALYMIYNLEPTLNSGTGNIIGGNMASTMAGEFAFSISLALCVLYMGFLVNGMQTGRYRRAAAVTLALCGLCHLIPVFFALAATAVALVVWPGRQRLKWALPVLPVAGLLSAFWVVPFLLRHPFVNDMGWERLPLANSTNADGSQQTIWDYLLARALWWPLALAAVGLVVSIVYQHRAGILLAATTVLSGAAFVWVPQARLWNARLLPFFYLSLFLLAAIGVSEVVRSIGTLLARNPDRPGPLTTSVGVAACFAFTLVFLGVPLGRLPGTSYPTTGGVNWLSVFHRNYRNDIPGWAKWNYEGLEAKPAQVGGGGKVPDGQGGWPEFRDMVATMGRLGQDARHGCGRAFWEYGDRLETYGTPMAPMMLPYFTNSCIGSMEGLYFESSATTPYHFLVQCELSDKGSCAQRDLAYGSFDLGLGIKQLELLGVKYYMAFTPKAVVAANADPTLTEVARSGPWHIYQLPAKKSALVTPLTNQPVVMSNIGDGQSEWLDPSAAWFLNPELWNVMVASSGPKEWPRIEVPSVPAETSPGVKRRTGERSLPSLPQNRVTPATVSNIESDDDSVSFDVDRTGSPVLVKTSYFPNWKVSGGKGPYRVAPNLMVVVPTSDHVTLQFGRTGVDWLATLMTLLGLAGLVAMSRLTVLTMPEPKPWFPAGASGGDASGAPPAGPYPSGPPPLGQYPDGSVRPEAVPAPLDATADFDQWFQNIAPPPAAKPDPDLTDIDPAGDASGQVADPEG